MATADDDDPDHLLRRAAQLRQAARLLADGPTIAALEQTADQLTAKAEALLHTRLPPNGDG